MSDPDRIELSALDLMPDWVTNLEKNLPHFDDSGDESGEDAKRGGRSRDRARNDRGGGRSGGRAEERRGQDRERGGGQRGRDGRGQAGPRRDFSDRGSGNRDREKNRDGNRDRDRRGGGRGFTDRDGRGRFGERRDGDGGARFGTDDRPPAGLTAVVEPSPESVSALARHIRGTGRTYSLSDLAKMVLAGRDRYQMRFRTDNPVERPLFSCPADGSVWLSRDEALTHVLRGPALRRFYRVEDVPVDPPKGNFAVVAVCGLSGTVLGPPNHHDYTIKLVRLHKERFSDMSFERFKSRVEMRRDEESIEKWKTEQSVRRQYRPRPEPLKDGEEEPEAIAQVLVKADEAGTSDLPADETPSEMEIGAAEMPAEAGDTENAPADPEPEIAPESEASGDETESADTSEADGAPETPEASGEIITSAEALERHFKQHFGEIAAQPVSEAVVSGNIPGRNLSRGLLTLLKIEIERQRKAFPLGVIQMLCRDFETAGLRFFKRGKKALHVSVARPRAIEDEEALSERVREIVRFVRENPRKKVVDLLDALVSDYQRPAEGESFEQHHLTEKEHAVLADLRWLTLEGYVLEFPGTELVLAKINPPAPVPKPEPAPAERPAAGDEAGALADTEESAVDSSDLVDEVVAPEAKPESASRESSSDV